MNEKELRELVMTARGVNNEQHQAAVLLTLDKGGELEMTYAGDEETVRTLLGVLAKQGGMQA